jgi:hypothetical protein
MPPSWTRERSRLALVHRHHPDDTDAIDAARRDLKAARAEDYVRHLVESAPPLSPEQRDRLAALLRPTSSQTSDTGNAA